MSINIPWLFGILLCGIGGGMIGYNMGWDGVLAVLLILAGDFMVDNA